MEVTIDADDVIVKEVDSQGRVYLGRDHAGEDVEIAVKYSDD
jgi:hypothetical protein